MQPLEIPEARRRRGVIGPSLLSDLGVGPGGRNSSGNVADCIPIDFRYPDAFIGRVKNLSISFELFIVDGQVKPIHKLKPKSAKIFNATSAIQANPPLRVSVVKIGINRRQWPHKL
jgi:hypothetical protein